MRLSAPIFRLKRQARLLARDTDLPLHRALDRIARGEGFRGWSHLAAAQADAAGVLLGQLRPGDLLLLAARPGQGKTLLALDLAAEAARRGRQSHFFTLEYTEEDVLARLADLGVAFRDLRGAFTLDTSDGICAGHIIARLSRAAAGTLAVIDYLQLLDQRRDTPALAEQIAALKAFAAERGVIVVALSQVDRAFARRQGGLPTLADIRLPNPLDLTLFTRACFLHEGEVRVELLG